MNITAPVDAAMQVHALALQNARNTIDGLQANPVPADAPAPAHADVILQLSSAAQSLLGR